MRSSVSISGIDSNINRLRRLHDRLPEAAGRGLLAGGRAIYAMSQATAPTLTDVPRASRRIRAEAGSLRASGRMGPLQQRGDSHSIRISYGPSRYATIQHYSERLRHKPPEKAHFLTDPLEQLQAAVVEGVRDAVTREIEIT